VTLANTYGYIVIYPDSPNTSDKCWDVSSAQPLSHNGGGDAQDIVVLMVK
jgi:acetylxylan esterase